LQCSGGPKAAVSGRPTLLFYRPLAPCQTCAGIMMGTLDADAWHDYPSFAFIEIFAFSTFDTGQPFSAASAYF